MVAGRLYLFAMDFLEQMALVEEPAAFAKAVKSLDAEQPLAAVAAWLKHPDESKKLLKALAAAYQDQVVPKSRGKKKRALEAESSSSADSDDNDSEESRPKKHKKKKSASSSSSSGSGKKPKKSRAKAKKSKKDRKHRKAENSESDAAPTSTKKKAGKAALLFDAEDLESSASEAAAEGEAVAFASWPLGEIQTYVKEVKHGLANVDKKQTRLPLPAIVGLLDNLPADVIEAGNLGDPHKSLKGLSRLPKAAKVRELLEVMKNLGERGLAAHEEAAALASNAEPGSPTPVADALG